MSNPIGANGPYNDFPLAEVREALDERLAEGFMFWQKFTCAGCGQRLTVEQPNTLYATANCDNCDAVTDIAAQGCNYLLLKTDI